MTALHKIKIRGWSDDELYLQVEYAGESHWVPVDTADDGDVVWVQGVRYSAETGYAKAGAK